MKSILRVSFIAVFFISFSFATVDKSCIVKGNISYNGNKKIYFTSIHLDYPHVKINRAGERCFKTEEEAKRAGWRKAPTSSYHKK